MAENAEAIVPVTTGAESAPGTTEGQAGGSPPPENDQTSGGNEGVSETEKALRQKITAQAEELKDAKEILDAASRTPEWKGVVDRLSGKPAANEPDLDAEVFGENVELGKKWRENMKKEIRNELLREMTPVIREVGETKQTKDVERALKAEGLASSPAFDTFKEDFEAENPSYSKLYSLDPKAATKWLASSFALKVKRDGRVPVTKDDATLERGGGPSGRTGAAASLVKIDRKDPDKLNRLFEAFKNGDTPVDENGRPYKVPGQK